MDIIIEDIMIGTEMTTVVAIPELTVAVAEITITEEVIMDVANLIDHIMNLTDDTEDEMTTIEKKNMMIVV